jgi:hypothetical protein
MKTIGYDVIGDVHGHAAQLLKLLATLGYKNEGDCFRHPFRKAVFLGDFIDRGPAIRETLETVRPMVEHGAAVAVLGNHELNAIAFHTADHAAGAKTDLRPRSDENHRQHAATLAQLTSAEMESYLAWFRTLPLWWECDAFRVVHACWDEQAVRTLGFHCDGRITSEVLVQGCLPGGRLAAPMEILLKGKEMPLPEGHHYHDCEGRVRLKCRTKWYESPAGHTYQTYALASEHIPCDAPVSNEVFAAAAPYPSTAKPVFIGHYGLLGPRPTLLASNVACVDWGVTKGGFLCAYRWSGEAVLQANHFCTVK